LKNQRAEIWLDGCALTKNTIKDQTSIYDLRSEIMMHFKNPLISLYVDSSRALIEIAIKKARPARFQRPAGQEFRRSRYRSFGRLPAAALDNPHQAGGLFFDHVAMAVQTHFLAQYVTKSRPLDGIERLDGPSTSDREAGDPWKASMAACR